MTIQLSDSERSGLLALAAKSCLVGDKRTDAVAGTIHAPTAARLVAKGCALAKDTKPRKTYCITDAGKAELGPEVAAMAPRVASDLEKTLKRAPSREPSVLIAAKELGKIAFVHADDKPKHKKRDSILVQPQADVERDIIEAPAIVRDAMAAPAPVAPPLVRDIVDPSAPMPVLKGVTPEIDRLVGLLHQSGTLHLRQKGQAFRINAQNHGAKGFEYWMKNPETGGWSRLLLGNLPGALDGVEFLDNQPEPGVRPFRAPAQIQGV